MNGDKHCKDGRVSAELTMLGTEALAEALFDYVAKLVSPHGLGGMGKPPCVVFFYPSGRLDVSLDFLIFSCPSITFFMNLENFWTCMSPDTHLEFLDFLYF